MVFLDRRCAGLFFYRPGGKSYIGRKDKMPVGKNVENKNEDVGGDV